jgi:sec-independent protein translocase protein TatB
MFNLGLSEIIVIAIVLIIVVGPERLPQVMKKVGGALRTVRQASREIQTTVGLDELWREDVMAPPRPRVPPNATVSRQAELGPSAAAAVSPADSAAPANASPAPAAAAGPAVAAAVVPAATPAAPAAPVESPAPAAPAPTAPVAAASTTPAAGDVKGES